MEISTFLGLVVGLGAMAGVLLCGEAQVSLAKFIDPPAILMVFGGAVAVALVGFPMKQVINLYAILRKPFFTRPENPALVIDELVRLAEVARKDGLLALEGKAGEMGNHFLAMGMQLTVDGTRAEVVEEILRTEMHALESRHRDAK